MEKNNHIHIITKANEQAQPVAILTRDPEKDRSVWIRGCCPTTYPFGDV